MRRSPPASTLCHRRRRIVLLPGNLGTLAYITLRTRWRPTTQPWFESPIA